MMKAEQKIAAKKGKVKKNPNGKRLILTPGQTGGAIPLIPIFAGLSALGSLMSGGASVYNAIQNSKMKKVFSRDDLPKKPRTIECGILNLDVSSGDGSHWVAFYKIKDKEEGCYEIEDINNKIAKELSQVNNKYGTQLTFSVRIDPVDFRTYIKCNGILQFNTQYSIAPVLGFKKIRCGPFHEACRSEKTANLNTINSIKVLCNIAHGSFNNQHQSHSIYEFFPSGRTGTKVVQSPSNLIYYRLNKTDINSITVQLVDQNNNPFDNFNETLTSVTLSLTGNATILSVNYFPSINLYEDSEIALLCLQSFNSFPNINENNNKFSIEIVDNENNNAPMMCYIKLEEGCYEIEDINQRVKKQIDVYNSENLTNITFDILVDPNDFRSYIKCNGELHFEIPYSIAPVLGFEKRQYKPEYEILRSEKAANLNTINSIKVMCNIAQGSFNNHLQSHSIYEFFPSGRTGSKVIQSPPNLIYYKLNKTNIDSITVQLVDQDHKPIDNFGETLTIVLHIKRYGS
ncbi:hypothetical protein AGLY_014046 [Aphis glycines]|uniref:Uncharacterized protein n=1 Tax=Aphis glycines TaxID=307491 RepID=A0A6G0T4K5_APHGL|nr:hypothetical protein AGLY_014046 [Aphis glycines]